MDGSAIIERLNWDNSGIDVEKAIQEAQEEDDLSCYLQKRVTIDCWDNCAKIFNRSSDEKLKPYLKELLEWIQDINWPGAIIIQRRLEFFQAELLLDAYVAAVNEAYRDNDEIWLNNLADLTDNKQLKILLAEDMRTTLAQYYIGIQKADNIRG